jgi:hypothetical protein
MYRILWPDGQLSGMVNLSRAKDAAAAICERGPPARNRQIFRWEPEPSKTGSGGSLARINGSAFITAPAGWRRRL